MNIVEDQGRHRPEEVGQKPDVAPKSEPELVDESHDPFKYQERNAFEDFLGTQDDFRKKKGVRGPTPEEEQEINEGLNKLADIFRGLDVNWQLDGAINISALNEGDFIRVHKDIDISIEGTDLEKIDEHLSRKGYGLFISYKKDARDPKSPMLMERVHADELRNSDQHPMLAAIDKQGKLVEGGVLNFVDTHIIKRDGDGDPVGLGDVKLPEKWFEPRSEDTPRGPLNFSHPAKVAFFKLHDERHYDMTDLEKLAGLGILTPEDVQDIRTAFTAENEALKAGREKVMDEIISKIGPDDSENEIFDAFLKLPAVESKKDDLDTQAVLRKISGRIAGSKDKSPTAFKRIMWDVVGEPLKTERVDILEKLVKTDLEKRLLEDSLHE